MLHHQDTTTPSGDWKTAASDVFLVSWCLGGELLTRVPKRRAVLLCGPARRLVAAVARELAAAGVPLVIQAAPTELSGARRLVAAAARRGGPVGIVTGALDGDDASRRLIAEAWTAGKGIGAVVLCVTVGEQRGVAAPSLDAWQDAIATGLRAPFFLAKHAAARMKSGGGRVVLASAAPRRAGASVAAVVRGGLECMAEALARAVPASVAFAAVFASGAGTAEQTASEVARAVRTLIAEQALPSGTIVDLAAAHRG